MADMNIQLPFEIQGEILKRVPEVKSLLRFRSVSKSWKCLIDSPRFIADYHPQPPRRHIFVRYYDDINKLHYYVSIIDNDDDDSHCFAQNKVPLTIPIPGPIKGFQFCFSQGLFCLYNIFGELPVAYLWNPSIRKLSVAIDLPNMFPKPIIAFGVSPDSSDPKLIKIHKKVYVSDLKPWQVEIYSLSMREWRTLSSEVLPSSSVVLNSDHHVAIGKYIFWLAMDRKYVNGMYMEREMIILFDMISEKFMEIYLPDYLVPNDQHSGLKLFKIRESLAVVVSSFNYSVKKQVVHVWVMEGGVSDSFTKMYSIRPDTTHISLLVLAFRSSGHPIIRVEHYGGEYELAVYEPDTEKFTPIMASRYRKITWYACSYMETLLLHDH